MDNLCQNDKTTPNRSFENGLTTPEPKPANAANATTNDMPKQSEQERLNIIRKEKRKEYLKKYHQLNKEKCKAKQKEYYELHKGENKERQRLASIKYRKSLKGKIKSQQYHKLNKEKYRESRRLADKKYYKSHKRERIAAATIFSRNRKKTDLNFKIACLLRGRMRMALKNHYKTGSAVRDLGCSIEQFKIYLESKFQPGMTWENHGFYGWHIDHFRPLSSFNLSTREEFLQACHYTNMQPLWAKDNLYKSSNY